MAFAAPRHTASGPETLTAEDFETASVHSAAPSYVSEAPSYHSTRPPPYTESDTNVPSASNPENTTNPALSRPTLVRSGTQQRGLPPVPSGPPPVPSLSAFSIPNWPTLSANPTTRHYHSVAQRRVAAATNRIGSPVHRNLLGRVGEEADDRPRSSGPPGSRGTGAGSSRDAEPSLLGWGPTSGRPLEDPSLVGEDAARRAREERLRRERDEALVLENRRWDWYLSQMNEWQGRQRGWSRLGHQMGIEERKSFMRRISGRIFC